GAGARSTPRPTKPATHSRASSSEPLSGPRERGEPVEELLAEGGIERHEGLEFAPRGLAVAQVEITPDQQDSRGNVGGVETQGVPAGRSRGAAVVALEVQRRQRGAVIRAPGIEGDGASPEGEGVVVAPCLDGQERRLSQRGFPARIAGQGRL